MSAQPRRQLLIDTAFELINEHGYHATGIDWILSEAGVSKATLYKHFRSKDALILAVLEQRHEQLLDSMTSAINKDSDGQQRVLGLFDALSEWFQAGNFYGCNFMKASAEYSKPGDLIHDFAARHKESVKQLVKENLPDKVVDKEEVAESILLLLDGSIVEAHVRGKKEAAKRAKNIAHLLLNC